MGSPRSFPRTVTLVEAFRRILRAMYSKRPGLADEIKAYNWLWFDPNRRCVEPDLVNVGGEKFWRGEERAGEGREDEEKAVNEAHRQLGELVRQGKGTFRLRGTLNPSKPLEDVDPADARDSKPHVFDGKLRVFDGDKIIKTYHRVHCYETDVDRRVAELCSETKLTDEALLQLQPEFVKNYLAPFSADSRPRPTQTELRKKWSDAGHGARLRDELDGELENQAKDKGILLKRGGQKKRAS